MFHGDGKLQSEIARRREEEVLRQVWVTETASQKLPLQEMKVCRTYKSKWAKDMSMLASPLQLYPP